LSIQIHNSSIKSSIDVGGAGSETLGGGGISLRRSSNFLSRAGLILGRFYDAFSIFSALNDKEYPNYARGSNDKREKDHHPFCLGEESKPIHKANPSSLRRWGHLRDVWIALMCLYIGLPLSVWSWIMLADRI
jgi:hypothetical protein